MNVLRRPILGLAMLGALLGILLFCVCDKSDGELVASWEMDDGSGQSATDSSGNGNHAQLGYSGGSDTTDPSWVEGIDTNALSFDGEDYVVTPVDIDPSAIPNMTACAWVNIPHTAGEYQAIISNDDGGYDRAIMILSDGEYKLFAGKAIDTNIDYKVGAWEFVAAYWSSTEIKFYRNGVEVFSTGGETVDSGDVAYIGADPDKAWLFEGVIDEVAIWDSLLSESEMLDHFNATRPPVHNIDSDGYHLTIQEAIDNANPGDALEITQGTYAENLTVDREIWIRDASFILNGTLTVSGSGTLHLDNVSIDMGEVIVEAGGRFFTSDSPDTLISENLWVDGDLLVSSSSWIINNTYDGEYDIQVNGTGEVYLQDGGTGPSVFKTIDPNHRYEFKVLDGAVFVVENSTIRDSGWDDDHPGLWVYADNAHLYNATLTRNYVGITLDSSSGSRFDHLEVLANHHGIHLNDSSPDIIETNIDDSEVGLVLKGNSSPSITNSSLSNITINDFQIDGNSHPVTLNTTFDEGAVLITDDQSNLTIDWFLHVIAETETGTRISDARVLAEDIFGTLIFDGRTDVTGQALWIRCHENTLNRTGILTNYNPHNVSARKGNSIGWALPQPIMDQSKEVTIVVDITLPELHDDNSQLAGTTGEPFYFETDASDNFAVQTVHVNYRYTGYSGWTNLSMSGTGPYNHTLASVPINFTGDLEYYFSAMDVNSNWNSSVPIQAIISDNDKPTFTWASRPTEATTGDPVLVSLQAWDNIGIDYFKIDIDGSIFDMVREGDHYNYTIDIPTDSLANISYFVTFNDTADNPNSTAGTTLTVTDNDAPIHTWVSRPVNSTTGEQALISVRAWENIGIDYFKIDIDGTLYDLVREGDHYNHTIDIPANSTDDISYAVIFNDTADNPDSTTQTDITVTDNDAPAHAWSSRPTEATTGEQALVSVRAWDNIGIEYARIDLNGTLYDLVFDGDYYNYTIDIPTNSTNNITYMVLFNDTADNPATIPTDITVTDNDKPTYEWSSRPTNGTTGDPVLISLEAWDNININYFKIDIGGSIFDMVKNGDIYSYILTLPMDSSDDVIYSVILNDTANNPNTTMATTITVVDDEPPSVTDTSVGTVTTGDLYNITSDVTDNIAPDGVWLEYELVSNEGYRETDNLTMLIGSYYRKLLIWSNATWLNYTIQANDTSNNWNRASYNRQVMDNDMPEPIWIAKPETGTTGEGVPVSLRVTDNRGITDAWIKIGQDLYDMQKDGNMYNHTLDIPIDSLADISYSVGFNDSAGNLNMTAVILKVIDNDIPELVVDAGPGNGTTGDLFRFNVTAWDNVVVDTVFVNWSHGLLGGNISLVLKEGFWQGWVILDHDLSDLTYTIHINDTSDNRAPAAVGTANVTDNDEPTFEWLLKPATGTTGEWVLVSLKATDNIGLANCSMDIDGVLKALTKEGDYYNFTIVIPSNSLAIIHYRADFNDTAGNGNVTTTTNLTVLDNDLPNYLNDLSDTLGTPGSDFCFEAQAQDNIGIGSINVNYQFNDDLPEIKSLSRNVFFAGSEMVPEDALVLYYQLIVVDTSGNQLTGPRKHVIVVNEPEPEAVSGKIGVIGHTILDDNNDPVVGALVTITLANGSEVTTVTDESGEFKAALPEGDYTYTVDKPGMDPISGTGTSIAPRAQKDDDDSGNLWLGVVLLLIVGAIGVLLMVVRPWESGKGDDDMVSDVVSDEPDATDDEEKEEPDRNEQEEEDIPPKPETDQKDDDDG